MDLSFEDTSDLIEEIRKRYDTIIVITKKQTTSNEEGCDWWHSGGSYLALGLLEWVKHGLLRKMDVGE